jgi:hypothetical protein
MHTHTRTRTRKLAHPRMHNAQSRTHMHAHKLTHANTDTHTHKHVHTHSLTDTCTSKPRTCPCTTRTATRAEQTDLCTTCAPTHGATSIYPCVLQAAQFHAALCACVKTDVSRCNTLTWRYQGDLCPHTWTAGAQSGC